MDNQLRESWLDLCRLIGVPEVTSAYWYDVFLLARYTDSARHYHTLSHISECLAEFDRLDQAQMEDPIALELAIWFHDLEYSTSASNNEEQSAEFATNVLTRAKVEDVLVAHVQDHILATKHDRTPTQPDTRLMVDIDLSILGKPQDRFNEYEQQIRKEYCDASDSLYRRGRSCVLQPYFQDRYEVAARRNIVKSLQRLNEKGSPS
jgi:predicted metal-dependent HD superfamily phosphohydrolase